MSCKLQYKPSLLIGLRFAIVVIGLLLMPSSHMILSVLSIDIESSPQNTVLLAGSVFQIACSNASNYLRFKSTPSAHLVTIYKLNPEKLNPNYVSRTNVSNVSTHSGRALLLISDINSQDAGEYVCSGPSRTSLLIVLG